jgi:ferredoxin-like protein FixX
MRLLGILYIYTWKCHNETPCIDILNKQKCLSSKMKDRQIKQVLPSDCNQWRVDNMRKGCRRVNMVEILCTHDGKWKNETFQIIPKMGMGE